MTRASVRVGVNVHIEHHDEATGQSEFREAHNIVTDDGLALMRDLFVGKAGIVKITHIAFGSGDTAPQTTDTALETEEWRQGLAVEPVDDDAPGLITTSYMAYLGLGAGALGSLTEMGLFNDSTAGDMFARVTFAAINKTVTSWVKIDWEVQLADDGV